MLRAKSNVVSLPYLMCSICSPTTFPLKYALTHTQIIDQVVYYTYNAASVRIHQMSIVDLNVPYDWDRSTTFSLALKRSHNQPSGGILPKLWETDHTVFYQNF